MSDNIYTGLYSAELLKGNAEPVFNNYYDIDFREGFSMPVHSHGSNEIMYIGKGNCEVFANETKYKLEAGEFIFLNANTPHRLSINKSTRCRIMCLEFGFVFNKRAQPSLGNIYENIGAVRFLWKEARCVIKLKDTAQLYALLQILYNELEHNEQGREIYKSSSCIHDKQLS